MRKLPKPPRMPTAHKRKQIPVPQLDQALGSNIQAHEYSPETGHLIVTFKGGRQYRYEGVTQDIADAMGDAPSKGSFLHSSVIGKFKATKI